MIRVVLDTNVLFSAILSPSGAPAMLLELMLEGLLEIWISQEVMAEYQEVLSRPVLLPHAPRVHAVLSNLRSIAQNATPSSHADACLDPDDNIFLDCCEAAQADFLITGNLKHFPNHWGSTLIVTPRQLLDRLRT